MKRNILLNPGPATTTRSVKQALVVPDICPREKEFTAVMAEVRRDLVKVVNGGRDYAAVLFAGSGTCGVEACICSVTPPGRKIAIVNNGAYGERMVRIAAIHGFPCVEIAFDWGRVPDVKEIERRLRSDRSIACLAMVHHETSTGLLNPVKAVGQVARANGCTFIVDGMSSFAGIPLNVKSCGVDFLVSTSNKCIQGMAGIAFAICSRRALEEIRGFPRRSMYLSLYDQYAHLEQHGQMPFTAPVQVIYALRQAIREYQAEGGRRRYERYSANWRTLRTGLAALGFQFMLPEKLDSRILTTVLYPAHPNFDFDVMHDLLLARGFTVYPGKMSGQRAFRLANMGDLYPKDIQRFLKAMKEVLTRMSIPLPCRAQQSESIGKALSDLARRGLSATTRAKRKIASGFPTFTVPKGARTITPEDVKKCVVP